MLSACTTWPNAVLCNTPLLHSLFSTYSVADVDIFISTIWLAALHHNFIIHNAFFTLGIGMNVCVCACEWMRMFRSAYLNLRFLGGSFFCTCLWSFFSIAPPPPFCLGAHSNYFILIFQFRNDNNNLPAAKPKIKFTAIQNSANNGIFVELYLSLSHFWSIAHSHLFACDYLHFCSIIYLRVKNSLYLSFGFTIYERVGYGGVSSVFFLLSMRILTTSKIYCRTISVVPTLYAIINTWMCVRLVSLTAQFTNIHLYTKFAIAHLSNSVKVKIHRIRNQSWIPTLSLAVIQR